MGARAFSSFESTILPMFSKPLCIIEMILLSLEFSLGASEACGIGMGTALVGVGEFSICRLGGSSASRVIGSIIPITEWLGEG